MRMHALCIYSRDPIAAENLSGSSLSLSLLANRSSLDSFLPSRKISSLSTHETRVRIARNFFFFLSFVHFFFFFSFYSGSRTIIIINNIDP